MWVWPQPSIMSFIVMSCVFSVWIFLIEVVLISLLLCGICSVSLVPMLQIAPFFISKEAEEAYIDRSHELVSVPCCPPALPHIHVYARFLHDIKVRGVIVTWTTFHLFFHICYCLSLPWTNTFMSARNPVCLSLCPRDAFIECSTWTSRWLIFIQVHGIAC